jgi:CheY-like chemotaxis protein
VVTALVAIALLGAVTAIAIAVAWAATLRARAARVALGASEEKRGESVELARKMEASSRLAADVAHDVNDLLTAITGHTELLIASLDPSGTSIQDAHEIQRAALSAARLTKPLRTPGGRPRVSTEVIKTAPVLVVEDEPHVRELIKVVLGRAGHEVLAVAGPHAALAALNRQPTISLMLVDVVMPVMGGYDLAAEARKISPGVHVVFMSAFARDTKRHPIGDGFLAKPFTVASLTGIVEEALFVQGAVRP